MPAGIETFNLLLQECQLTGFFDQQGYNIGARKVSRKVSQKDPWPKEYAGRVMKHYMEFYDLMASEQQEVRMQASTASL